jgi:DNA-binding beta-propeller fold protein YncE
MEETLRHRPRGGAANVIPDRARTARDAGIDIDVSDESVQRLAPPSDGQRFEGIAFSSTGDTIAVATADTDTVFLFRRRADGLFEDRPYCCIDGARSKLNYPHDVSFSRSGDTELLAVAQRRGAIAIYDRNRADDHFGPDPVFEICGPRTQLHFSDGVAFVPPAMDHLAACNLQTGSLAFFRRQSRSPTHFGLEPAFELRHPSLCHPDGLAFSECGRWLAVANHGNHSVSVFQRRNRILARGKLRYGPEPVTIIRDPELRHPHSVAFTRSNHLLVTNAGANYFSVYAPIRQNLGMRWSRSSVLRRSVGPDRIFEEVNARNRMEGGPKGIATHGSSIAICSAELGVTIYSLRDSPAR